MAAPAGTTALARARQRDVDRRRQRVYQALSEMKADGADINVSATASRARVHRSFIHRHSDLHAAVLAAAAETIVAPSSTSAMISHRSLTVENVNLHEQNKRLGQHIRELEDRLSEQLGSRAFERSGLGAPTGIAALQAELEAEKQANLELKGLLEERDEELGAARETIRRLMGELNRGT